MSKKNTIYYAMSALVLLVLVMPACDWFKKKTESASVAAGTEHKFHLLDADSAEVYNDAHIPGAVNVSFENVDEMSKSWNKETPVVVYCSSYACPESHRVAKKLKDLGFKDVGVYSGGINEWYRLGKENKAAYPLEGEAKLTYLNEEVAKSEPKLEEGIRSISAADLSKMTEESKAPAEAAPVAGAPASAA